MIERTKKIGEILIERGYINSSQLEQALMERKTTGEKIGEVLVRKGLITLQDLNKVLVTPGIRVFDVSSYVIDPEAIELIPFDVAAARKIIPIAKKGQTLIVGMADPTNTTLLNELNCITGVEIEAVLADEIDIRIAQNQSYNSGKTIQKVFASADEIAAGKKGGTDTSLITKLVNALIEDAIRANVSDVHIEPEEKRIGVRYRVDGMLRHYAFLDKSLEQGLASRFKIIAGLDITERRIPQDGRVVSKVSNRDIDFRISTCPTVHGENIVLRILDKAAMNIDLESLGIPARQLSAFKDLIEQPHGIVLVTGPSGSGKTTTLYSALQKINRENTNIMTVEDPVEYQFPRIRQVEINPKIGLTFASVLRSFLRQDPDVIMIGEIRDSLTTEIAVQAALTGHLVLSTLHTNDASTAFTRLIDMGIEPFLVSDSIKGVLAQFLIRKVCPKCKKEYTPSDAFTASLRLGDKVSGSTKFVRGIGCDNCFNTGYKGRTTICELLVVTPEIQNLVLNKASPTEIRNLARKQGMKTLREVAIEKLLAGITSPLEMMRVT